MKFLFLLHKKKMTPNEIKSMVSEFVESIKQRPVFKGKRFGEKKDSQHVSSYLPRMAKYFYPNETMTSKMLLKVINEYDSYRGKRVHFTRKKTCTDSTYSKPRNLAYVVVIKSTNITFADKTVLNLEAGDLFIIGPSLKNFEVFGREFIVFF